MNTPKPCDQCLHCICKLAGTDEEDCELGLVIGNKDCEGFVFFDVGGKDLVSDEDYVRGFNEKIDKIEAEESEEYLNEQNWHWEED